MASITEAGDDADGICAAVTCLIEDLSIIANEAFNLPSFLTANRGDAVRAARRTLDDFAERLLIESSTRPARPTDFLAQLLRSGQASTGGSLSETVLRDEIVTMIVAGHETTATILTWAWHLIATHSAVEDRMHAEIDGVLRGRMPAVADLPQLRYTWAVLQETMRLYPPVWFMIRRAMNADEVGGQILPAGAYVLICPFTLHRHATHWREPERFNPERFMQESAEQAKRSAYIPFSSGRHHCLGTGFATMELPLLLAALGVGCRVKPVRDGLPGLVTGMSLRAAVPTLASLERRQPSGKAHIPDGNVRSVPDV